MTKCQSKKKHHNKDFKENSTHTHLQKAIARRVEISIFYLSFHAQYIIFAKRI